MRDISISRTVWHVKMWFSIGADCHGQAPSVALPGFAPVSICTVAHVEMPLGMGMLSIQNQKR